MACCSGRAHGHLIRRARSRSWSISCRQDAAPKLESPKSEESKLEDSRPEPLKAGSLKSEPTKPNQKPAPKSDAPKSETAKSGAAQERCAQSDAPKSEPPTSDFTTAPLGSAEERAATAARLAWMLGLPPDTTASLAAPPSENKTNLTGAEVAEFKARVSKCWVVPAGVPSTPGFDVLMRIALNPDGTLGARPELVRAPASLAGPPLVDNAKRALQKVPALRRPAGRQVQGLEDSRPDFHGRRPRGPLGPAAASRPATNRPDTKDLPHVDAVFHARGVLARRAYRARGERPEI